MLQIDSKHDGTDFIAVSDIDALLLSREVEKKLTYHSKVKYWPRVSGEIDSYPNRTKFFFLKGEGYK